MPATFELALGRDGRAAVLARSRSGIIARRSGGAPRVDYAATTLALLGISMPNFWLGPLLAIVFSIVLGWLPVSGRGTPAHLVLAGDHTRRAAGRRCWRG